VRRLELDARAGQGRPSARDLPGDHDAAQEEVDGRDLRLAHVGVHRGDAPIVVLLAAQQGVEVALTRIAAMAAHGTSTMEPENL
jgi:hypothetical protein